MFRILLEYAGKAGFSITVPEVVVMELVNQVREKIATVAEENNERLDDLVRMTGVTVSSKITKTEMEKELIRYDESLRKKLQVAGVTIASIPNVSHQTILKRDLERRKPFKKGKGYRDALIWETILNVARETDDRVKFITKNSGDFANDEKNLLHDDLSQDLIALGLDSSKVTLSPSLVEFLKNTLIPELPSPDQTMVNFIQKGHPTFRLEDALQDILSEYLVGREIEPNVVGKPSEYEDVIFSMIESVCDVDILDEHELTASEQLIEVKASLDCEFEAFIFKSDLWCMDEYERPFVHDADWNKHLAAVSFTGTVHVQLYITLNMEEGKITSVDILEIQGADLSR